MNEALASLSRAPPPAAWHAADSCTVFIGNGIKNLLLYQHGSLASCRKGDILGGTEVESGAVLLKPRSFLTYPLVSFLTTSFFVCFFLTGP